MAEMSWAERMAYMRALTRDEQVAELQGRLDYVAPVLSPEDQLIRDALREAIRLIITDLKAEKNRAQAILDATNTTINSNPAGYIKDSARAAKRIADAAIDLAKFVKDINI